MGTETLTQAPMHTDLAAIKNRCAEVGECWIWQQGTACGYPQMKMKGHDSKLVRRIVVSIDGRPANLGQPVASKCHEMLCVNPAHLFPSGWKSIGASAARRGSFDGVARAAKIAATKRLGANAKLTMEIAREIRLSSESGPVLAARYGVHRGLVNRIKRGEVWRDFSSPFAGLGARS